MQHTHAGCLPKGIEPQGPIPTRRVLFSKAMSIAWPSVAESFLVALVGVIDTMMVGTLGSYAIAAVGLTNQPKMLVLAVFTGLNVAVSATVARRRGEGDQQSANRVLTQSLIIVLGLTLLLGLAAAGLADPIMLIAGSAPDTHADAVTYYRIIMLGLGFTTITLTINAAQRGCGNTKIALRTNMVSNLVNVCLNYLLIGGNCGFPRLGVAGAAIATVIGSICGLAMSLRSISHADGYLFIFKCHSLKFDSRTIKGLFNIGFSTFFEQVFMRVGFIIYIRVVAGLGTSALAAYQIGINVLSLSFSLGDGLGAASIALVGRSLGAGRQDLAKLYGSTCQKIGIGFSVLISLAALTIGRAFFALFTDDPAVLAYSGMLLAFISIVTFLQISQVVFASCLRAGGDTVYTAIVALVSVTLVRTSLGWLFCYPMGLDLFGAWLGLSVDQFLRFSLNGLRFKGGRWLNIKV